MANVAATHTMERAPDRVPYAPSRVDRLTAWVARLSLPPWVVYIIPAVALFVLITLITWWDGSVPVWELVPFYAVPGIVMAYGLALVHYLDRAALRTLETAHPVLNVDDEGYRLLRYELSTMPARPALLASVGGVVVALVVILALPESLRGQMRLFTSPAATALEVTVFIALWAVWGPLTYHTVRQLSLVNKIYTRHTHIDVFNLDPLYSFSWLTARTALSWIVVPYMFVLPVPGILSNALTFAVFAFNLLLGAVAFIWPLLGAHRMIEAAKKERQREADLRFDALTAELHRRADRGEFDGMAGLNEAMEAVQRERDVLEKVRTWPWRGETINVLSTALLLPAVLWFITRLLEKFGL